MLAIGLMRLLCRVNHVSFRTSATHTTGRSAPLRQPLVRALSSNWRWTTSSVALATVGSRTHLRVRRADRARQHHYCHGTVSAARFQEPRRERIGVWVQPPLRKDLSEMLSAITQNWWLVAL